MEGSYKQVSTWDTDEVVAWIRGLDERLSVHIQQFQAHCICGTDLLKLSRQQLEYLKVKQIGHQELLLEAVELLAALENGRKSTIFLASNLSKRTSQLVNALSPSSKKAAAVGDRELGQLETTAGVMLAAKGLVNWLDRNPSTLISDYESFRQDVLKNALDLSSMLHNSYDKSQMLAACRRILSLTSVMMSPQNFSVIEPVNMVTVLLRPKEDTGLGFSIRRTRQGNLLVSKVNEGSPAAVSDMIHIGDEIVQINEQNVVGWEMGHVVETLKASGHEVALVIKVSTRHLEAKGDFPDAPLGYKGEKGEVQDLDYDCLNQETMSPKSDVEVGLPPQLLLERNSGMDVKRTVSTPTTNGERAQALESSTPQGDDPAPLAGEEDTDGGSRNIDSSGRGHSQSFEERLEQRSNRNGGVQRAGKEGPQNQYPAVAYRTQIVGGVVMRIPITEDQGSGKPKKDKGGPVGKKPGKGKKRQVPPSSPGPEPPSPVDDLAIERGKAVFSDPKEITIGGQAIKQITVSGSEPSYKEEPKKANPDLMVPCFQLKGVDHEGWMNKMGGSGLTPKNWRRRWFVLKGKQLFYYKTSFDISALGIVELRGYKIEAAPEIKKKNGFKACRHGARTYFFQADNPEDMMRWMQVLKEASEADSEHLPADLPASIEVEDKSDDELS